MRNSILVTFLSFCFIFNNLDAQVKVVADGDMVVGNEPTMDPGQSNLKTYGLSQLELAIDAGAGNPDFTFQEMGQSKAQVKYETSLNGIIFNVNDSNGGWSVSNSYQTLFCSGNNQRVGIGTTSPVSKLHVNGVISHVGSTNNVSDARLKKDIKDFSLGLNELMQLRPVNFNYNGKAGIDETEKRFTGLIAQELQKVAPNMVHPFKYIKYSDSKNGEAKIEKIKEEEYLQIEESAIKYILINAVKEQQQIIADQNKTIEDLLNRVEQIEKQSNSVSQITLNNDDESNLTQGIVLNEAFLGQNTPNPFGASTSINYFIPTSAKNANVLFFNQLGQLIKKMNIDTFGSNKLEINSEGLLNGIYTYQLEIDGVVIDSKRMINNK